MSELLLPKGESLLSPEEINNFFKVNNPKSIEMIVVDMGQPRIGSTARAVLLGSGEGFSEIHFQPWKYIQRYARRLEDKGFNQQVCINGNEKGGLILLKETPGGPNDEREFFDPIEMLLKKQIPPEKIRVMIGVREPFSQFNSWHRFDNRRQPRLFLSGQEYLFRLIEKYSDQNSSIITVPFIFELFYDYPERYLRWIYEERLGLAGKIGLPEGLKFSENPAVIWHEADRQLDFLRRPAVGLDYFNKVVAPVLDKGFFSIPEPKMPNSVNPFFSNPFLRQAATNYLALSKQIYEQSTKKDFPRSEMFEEFLKQYENLVRSFN